MLSFSLLSLPVDTLDRLHHARHAGGGRRSERCIAIGFAMIAVAAAALRALIG